MGRVGATADFRMRDPRGAAWARQAAPLPSLVDVLAGSDSYDQDYQLSLADLVEDAVGAYADAVDHRRGVG